ncbi:hypothetical protein AB0L41_27630 [Amycolatopsis mediterranei]
MIFIVTLEFFQDAVSRPGTTSSAVVGDPRNRRHAGFVGGAR